VPIPEGSQQSNNRYAQWFLLVAAMSRHLAHPRLGNGGGGSMPTCEHQHNYDDQDDTEGADATVSEATTVTAE